MLKLIRNTLGEGGVLMDKDGNKVYWQYIIALHKLQDEEGLRLGNKLNLAHIQWWQQKMKANLAAQAFSSSVADAIEYCTNTPKLPQFQGSEATVQFIRLFYRLFLYPQLPKSLCQRIQVRTSHQQQSCLGSISR